MIDRCGVVAGDLSDLEWDRLEALLPSMDPQRGGRWRDHRQVINGILWRIENGAKWDQIPERYGPATTCSNRFRRWAKIGVWDRIFEAVSRAYDGDLQMIDSTSIRVHQHGGNGKRGARIPPQPRLGTMLERSAWGARAAG